MCGQPVGRCGDSRSNATNSTPQVHPAPAPVPWRFQQRSRSHLGLILLPLRPELGTDHLV